MTEGPEGSLKLGVIETDRNVQTHIETCQKNLSKKELKEVLK